MIAICISAACCAGGLLSAATHAAGSEPSLAFTTAPAIVTHSAPCSSDDLLQIALSATVNPEGVHTHWYFQYGPTTAYGTSTELGDAGRGTSFVPVGVTLVNVRPGDFHFRLVTVNDAGRSNGPDQTLPRQEFDCPAATSGSVPWHLVRLTADGRSATIRFRVACPSSPATVYVRPRPRGALQIAVIATAVPHSCPRGPDTTTTVSLPHRAARQDLRHAPATP
jgi:hypothetical protein